MIKLVVCDVDGTLLPHGNKFLSGELINIIKEFNKKNIMFAVASGRQYCELRQICECTDGIFYISADGGAVVYDGKILDTKVIPSFSVRNVINKPNLVFHSVFDSYCTDLGTFGIIKEKYGADAFLIKDNIDDINEISDRIIKISKFSPAYCEAPQCTYEVYKTREWTEWIKAGAGKERAIEFIQKRLKINVSETAVFGDGYNDIGMMRRGAVKFVMKNSALQNKIPGSIITDDILKELVNIDKR